MLDGGIGRFEGEKGPIVKYRDCLPSAVQERPNRSRCRLGRGLVWVQGSIIRWGTH